MGVYRGWTGCNSAALAFRLSSWWRVWFSYLSASLPHLASAAVAVRRVLFAVAKGETLEIANKKALEIVDQIECDNLYHRTDIGAKAYKKY